MSFNAGNQFYRQIEMGKKVIIQKREAAAFLKFQTFTWKLIGLTCSYQLYVKKENVNKYSTPY